MPPAPAPTPPTRRSDQGFTLIELLIVIVILGILAAVVVFAVNGINDRGKASACKADVASVTTASEAYFAQKGTYASGIPALVTTGFLHNVPGTANYTVTYVVNPGSPGSVTVASTFCP